MATEGDKGKCQDIAQNIGTRVIWTGWWSHLFPKVRLDMAPEGRQGESKKRVEKGSRVHSNARDQQAKGLVRVTDVQLRVDLLDGLVNWLERCTHPWSNVISVVSQQLDGAILGHMKTVGKNISQMLIPHVNLGWSGMVLAVVGRLEKSPIGGDLGGD